MAATRLDGRVERGNQTRRLILDRAARIASVEGLEGLSLGRLAKELELSKSGVFTLFGSKEELQLATVEAARTIYTEHVVRPALEAPAGLARIVRLCDRWLAYSEERVFPGGCFFFSVAAEFDARRGRVHDSIVQARTAWAAFVTRTLEEALHRGELTPDTDIPQLAFEVMALLEAANADSLLHDEEQPAGVGPYRRARRAILGRLTGAAADPSALPAAAD
ncbi:TetR/AcrR family transcriptional regulator [Streptomyces sp. WMMB303]|uniref:TetR/AcrR family transcriptional regulator n=1 Tax=Streptomyces sp. WMMB303 TaxID=3034154 RepID=UPI0023EBEA40|nr:TetR/AcrR family transcriptional regulator [Streptomyces sp. WMMB303]MDF4250400.1 TetR/AcrR family transcriptional regulator [Streptomyces sp. WMMB303]